MNVKKTGIIISIVLILGLASAASAEWEFGIGTGVMGLNAKGDLGLHVELADIGPVVSDVNLSPSDFMDYMETMLGFEGYATDGKWLIQYKWGRLKISDDPGTTLDVYTITSDFSFDIRSGEMTVAYPFYDNDGLLFRGYTGFRYIKHKLKAQVWVNDVLQLDRSINESWTDALFGVSADVPLAYKWNWRTKFDAGIDGGYGNSKGSYFLKSEIFWAFAKNWTTSLYGQYYSIKYESSRPDRADWYLYDVNEYGLGLSIFFNW